MICYQFLPYKGRKVKIIKGSRISGGPDRSQSQLFFFFFFFKADQTKDKRGNVVEQERKYISWLISELAWEREKKTCTASRQKQNRYINPCSTDIVA